MLNLVFLLIVMLFSIYLIIVRGTLPRYRIDQLQLNVWKDWIFVWLSYFMANIIVWLFLIG